MKKIIISDEETLSVPDKVFEELKQKYGEKNYSGFEVGSEYYYLDGCNGYVLPCTWYKDSVDKSRFEMGNAFKTREEAEAYAEWLKAVATIRRSSDYEAVWDGRNMNYVIQYAISDGALYIDNWVNTKTGVHAYYSSKEDAEKALADPEVKHAYEVVFGVAE